MATKNDDPAVTSGIPRGEAFRERQQETREAAEERLQHRKGQSLDTGSSTVGWTAQQGPPPEGEQEVRNRPQTFTKEQLPDPEVARAANFTPQFIPQSMIAEDEDAYDNPSGPEPGEQARAKQRADIKARIAREAVESERDALVATNEGGQRNEELRSQQGSTQEEKQDGAPTLAELQERAQELGIEGRSNMNKDELQKAVEEAEAR